MVAALWSEELPWVKLIVPDVKCVKRWPCAQLLLRFASDIGTIPHPHRLSRAEMHAEIQKLSRSVLLSACTSAPQCTAGGWEARDCGFISAVESVCNHEPEGFIDVQRWKTPCIVLSSLADMIYWIFNWLKYNNSKCLLMEPFRAATLPFSGRYWCLDVETHTSTSQDQFSLMMSCFLSILKIVGRSFSIFGPLIWRQISHRNVWN